jgi:ADP-heptose:LPS heptosyltransferase
VFLHIADMFRVPAIGLFGPTSAHEWGIRFGPQRSIAGQPGMADIAIEQVLSEMTQLLPGGNSGALVPA